MFLHNKQNQQVILEVTESTLVSYTGGESVSPDGTGSRLYIPTNGTIVVQLVGQEGGQSVTREIVDAPKYSSERVLKVIEAGTTINNLEFCN